MKGLNKLSFGYYKFISAGKMKPASSDSSHTMEKKPDIFQWNLTRFKKKGKKRYGLEVNV